MLEWLLVSLLGWMTGFEFHLTPPITKEIKHFRMPPSEKRGRISQLCNRDATRREGLSKAGGGA